VAVFNGDTASRARWTYDSNGRSGRLVHPLCGKSGDMMRV